MLLGKKALAKKLGMWYNDIITKDSIKNQQLLASLSDVGIQFVTQPNAFYRGDIIVCCNSFMQNYKQYLCQTSGAELALTPLYYKEADYKFSTLVYHIVDAIGFRRGSTVTTVLDTEADYLVKSPLGLDPERISETTVHFFKTFELVLLIGFCAVTGVVYLESEHMRFDFSVFVAFGADNKRLAGYMLYKMLVLSLLIQIPCMVLSYIAGFLRYGLLVFSVSPVLFLRSMLIVMVMLESIAATVLKIQTEQTVIRRMTSENKESEHPGTSDWRKAFAGRKTVVRIRNCIFLRNDFLQNLSDPAGGRSSYRISSFCDV